MKRTKTIEIDEESEKYLTIMLNIDLRETRLTSHRWHSINRVFKALTGKDHENITRYPLTEECQ